MWLSRGLLASTLILAVKAQDGIEDAAMRIATGFAESLIQHAVKTLSGDAGGAGDTVNAGDQGNQGNQGQAFDATLIDAATVTHTVGGQAIIETYTRPGGQLFPVTLLPHPRITIAPTTDDPYERIIQAYTGGEDATTNQEITIAEPTGTKPGTVIVDVPGSAYSSFSSGQAGALTIPPSNDHPTATIISALPSGVGITGEATRTIPAAGGASATVVIQTPWEDVPPSTPGAGAGLGGGAGGNAGGSTSDVLVIQTYTGTEYITQARVTTITGSGGDQGTVVVQVPPGNQNPGGAVTIPPSGDSHFTTIVRQYTGDTPISTPVTRLVPTSGTQDGTIIIETPGPSSPTGSSGNQGGNSHENQPQVIPPNGDSPYSTILRPHAGSGEITEPVTYTIPPSGTNPGTVIIETPAVRVGQSVITLPSDPGSGYITIVRQPTGTGVITAATTITVPPSNGQPGTIIIETPSPQPGGGEITIPAGADGSFVTVIRGPTGSDAVNTPTTITVSGAPGQPGTVIIETPVGSGGQTTREPDDPFTIPPGPGGQYVTVFRPHSGEPITVPITLTQPGQNGQPGTIIIETPIPTTPAPGSGPITIPAGDGGSYVTVYRPHSGSPINQPITITIPPNGGRPGTIIVETPFNTPKGQNAVTSNEPGGQQITIPPSKNNPYVTIYRPHTGDPITVPITITQSPSDGQPGTIIIETPAPEPQTVTEVETAPGATVTVQPNTPGGYTTIYRPHTGEPISEPITVTTISGSNGQPGTVIIETQGPITITPTGSGGTATIYTPGTGVSTTVTKTIVSTAQGGQSTTVVIIETPPVKIQPTQSQVTGSDGFVTVTEQYSGTSVITAIFTTTIIASGTGPGTVFIETPPPIKFNPTTSASESTVTGSDNYVTVFKPFPGPGIITAPITVTEATPSGGQPGTVVIQTPVSENPTTSLPQPSTTQGTDGTQAPSGGNPGTVFITTPAPQPTTTTSLPEPSTTSGPDGYVTVFLPFPGPGVITQSYTRTQAPSGGSPGTVFITTPAPLPQTTAQQNLPSTTSGVDGYVTVFIPYPGPGQITAPITSTQPPANGQPGTVFITTPIPAFSTPKQANGLTSTSTGTDGYVTVFIPYPGPDVITAPITSTQAPANGQPGTVFITTPAPVFSTPKQANGLTSTSTGTDGYVTVFVPYPGPGSITADITSTQPPANGQPGTVYITTPAPAFSTPKQANGLTSTTTGTDGYVTVFVPYPGPGSITADITSTQPPANGQPGTVYITTPAPVSTAEQNVPSTSAVDDGYVTVFLPFPGPGTITAPITSTQPPSDGNPGTVFITTPAPPTSQQGVPNTAQGDGGYVTVFLPYTGTGVITAPITSTQAPSGGNPGTVFITTPASGTATQSQTPALITDNYITIHTPFPGPGVITSPITITRPPADGQPGTVIIQTPAPVSSNADSYVTVYRPYPGPGTITAPITLTQAPTNGQPGTVFIETQPTNEPTSSPTHGDSASPITIPPAPTGSYVTIYRPYPGPGQISSAVTYTQAPVSGQPGTVIIETPNSDAPTATQTGPVTVPTGNNNPYVTVYRPYPGPGNIDQPITITSVTASGDQPGTIVIETPTLEVNTKFAPSPTTSPPVTIPADGNNYVTVYRPHTGSPITAPITVTTIAPTGGQPGTVIIETPGPESQPSSTDSPPVTIPQGQDGYVTVYQPYPGPGTITEPVTVSTIAPSNGQPGTVVIQTPVPAASTSSTGEQATTASAVTIPADDGGYVTVYRPFPGPGTITAPRTVGTVAPTSGRPGTVIIETPAPQATNDGSSSAPAVSSTQGTDGYVTVFRPYTGTSVIGGPITVSTIPPSNGQPGTIIVETPAAQTADPTTQTGDNAPVTIPPSPENTYVTVYRPHTGANLITAPVIVTTIQGENGQPGTIIIETPATQAPTSTDDSRGASVTIPPGPENSYLTVYRPHTGTDSITAPVTVTTIEGVNGQPGTIIIETPAPMSQTPIETSDGTGATSTAPLSPGSSYVTVYRPYTGTETITAPITVTTIAPTGGQPGTVIIETLTSSAPDNNAPSTVPPGPGSSYVTVYRPYTGTESITAPITSTIEGTNGQPGTVVIETPTSVGQDANAPSTAPASPGSTYITVYEPYPGPGKIDQPITVTTVEPSNGNPGTVIIQTPGIETGGKVVVPPVTVDPAPGGQYTTVYRPHTGTGVITAPVTITTIAPAGGQPGTVIIETPEPETPGPNPTVTLTPGPNESYVTVFQPHTGTDVITGPVVITTIAPANGQPGTVIIETPVAPESSSTLLPAESGTVVPQATATYVTVYRPHTGPERITAPVTVTTISPSADQPGTVIVETPDQDLPPVTTSAGPAASYVTVYQPHTGTDRITAPVTITTIEPINGQPGTVIIETPGQQAPPVTSTPAPASYITISRPYTGTEQITEPITTTVPPQGDQPGTVIVETPGQKAFQASTASPPSYVTISRPYTGTEQIAAPIVTTISPQGDQPGTVIYETQAPFATVYRPYTGTGQITEPLTVSTIPPNGDQPGTIIVETPGAGPAVTTTPPAPSYVTITNPYTGTQMLTEPTTVTTLLPQGDQPGTVIVETQGPYVTISTLYTGVGTITGPVPLTTIPPQGNQPGTVVIGTLGSYVTITTQYTGTELITAPRTITTIPPRGDQPGTVVVETPQSYITTTVPYTGVDQITAPITATTIPPSGDLPGTVVVQTQAPFATVYRPHTGADRITAPVTVSTIAPNGDQPGTIIVETPGSEPPVTTTPPAPSYSTIYEEYTGTGEITEASARTTIQPQGDQPGTIIFDTPGVRVISTSAAQASYVTVYQPHTGTGRITEPVTVTTIAPQGGQPGTVIIETPGTDPAVTSTPALQPSYVTVYQPHTGPDKITEPITITTVAPQGDQPGTVIIETPGSEPPITSGPAAEPSYVTIYQPHTGPDQITAPITVTTIEPQGTQPGTVIIETPGSQPPVTSSPVAEPSYLTVFRPHTGLESITAPVTITTIKPQGGQPGTVIIETPGPGEPLTSAAGRYTTIYEPHTGPGEFTGEVTRTIAPPEGDRPGTVVVETAGSGPTAASGRYTTIYEPHTGTGQYTGEVTRTIATPEGDRPGTVVIETAGSAPTEASGRYTTIYEPHTGPGEFTGEVTRTVAPPEGDRPGTVVVEMSSAPGQYTTIYEPHTGAGEFTGEVTRTIASPQGNQPGTVVIETPRSAISGLGTYTTIYEPHTGPGEFTGEVTRTVATPHDGQPGIIVVETLMSGTAALTAYTTVYEPHTGPGDFTGEVTRTVATPHDGQPGTIVIETEVGSSSAPGRYTTIYEPHTGTGEFTGEVTRTIASPHDGQPGTVVIETPGLQTANKGANPPLTIPAGDDSYVTVFRPYTGTPQITAPSTVTTIAPSNGQPGTVIIETPVPETTSSSDMRNSPVTVPAGDDKYVTVFRPHTGTDVITAPVTVTTIAPSGGQPGTVIIETPEAITKAATTMSGPEEVFVTIYRPYTGTEQITAPVTVTTMTPVSGTGTVIIETLAPQSASTVYVTIYRPYTGTARITEPTTVTTISPVSGTGTVIVETPTPESSVNSQPATSSAITIPSNDENRNVTVIKPYPGPGSVTAPVTRYVPPTAAGEPGTVIIETPVEESTTEAQPQSQPTSAPAVTIPPSNGSPNITIVREYPGPGVITAPVTSYEPPTASGQHGTVIIETPAPTPNTMLAPIETMSGPADTVSSGPAGQNVTFYTLAPPGVKTPITSYAPPQTPGQTGTVFIQTVASEPGMSAGNERNVTITTDGSVSLTGPYTRYQPPGTPGDPGTVIIETPPVRSAETTSDSAVTIPAHSGNPNVTVIRGGPGKEATTIYVPPTGTEPGTIIIETPTDAATTREETTSEDQMTTEKPAVTLPPSSNSPNVTVIRPYPGPGSITEPVTRYVPPTASGEPGTIIIETQSSASSVPTSANPEITLPPSSQSPNVTVIRPYPGPGSITEPVTRYVPPTASGEPGTVIIETQSTDESTELSTSSHEAQATSGDSGITIPAHSGSPNATVFRPYTGPGTIETPITSYIPPTNPGEPGTVVIETPVSRPESSSQQEVPSTSGPASIAAVLTTGGNTTPFSSASSNPDALTITPTDTREDVTIIEPNTKFPGATENVTQIVPPSGTAPGTKIIYTPVNTSGQSSVGTADTDSYVTISATVTIPGDPSTRTGANSNAGSDAGTTGAETNVIIIPPSGTEPGTVVSQTSVYLDQTLAPHGNVTITRAAPAGSSDLGTVIVEIPDYNVTTTRAGPPGVTTTLTTYSPPASPGAPGMVIVETPDYNVTVTRQAPASVTSLRTTYAPPGTLGDPGTVIVETPNNEYNVTITRGASITAPLTTYSPPGSAGDPGTIIVETPDYNVTVTTQAPDSITSIRTKYVPPASAGDPGTVVVETPNNAYNVTVTRAAPASVTKMYTTYSPPGAQGDPGTVFVETPNYNVTITRQGPKTATAVFSTYSPPGEPGDPGTIIVETPSAAYNVTTTRGASTITTPFTTYLSPGEAGDPGTVLVETPDYNVTITRQAPKSVTSLVSIYSPPGSPGDPGTVIIETPMGPYNITTTRGASSVTAPVTTYMPPGQAGDPGTVLVETPEYNVTITSQATDSVSDTVTRYNPPASPGDPGTVAIIMPNQKVGSTSPNPSITDAPGQNVTVYRPGPRTLTGPVTSYIPPASRGENGTVIIETPGPATPFNITTTQTVSTITAIYTTYLPAGAENDPGTILVEVPPSRNVTITKDDATITAPYTTYSPPGTAGDPGTVIIGMPADRNVSITTVVNTRTAPYTTYMPPGNRGDPGTVVVELPPDSNVTTTKTVSDRTAVYTTYSAPANRGDPGTIIIEVPPGRNVTVTEVASTITSPYTSYSSPARQGDPGTVFIGLPPDSNVTITTEVPTRTAPYTTYSPPAKQGDPGTVVVELPSDRNTTITKDVASRTQPFTTYMSPANKGDPGTVIVEMPPDRNVTITTEVPTRTKPYTTFATPANKGDPGTVIVEIPPDRNVTITTEATGLTAPYTSYALPGSQGDPGTVIIGMPPDRNVTITTEVLTRTAAYTTYSAPGARGDPGTVIIELPPDRNVTITTEVPGRTAAFTTFASPATKGYPGTVIIELPPDRNITTTEQVPTLTQAYTTYSSPGSRGDPGTVIVRLPPDRNVTRTTVVDTLTAPSTVYSAPANRGDPGTIIIEMPPARNVTTTEVVNSITRATTTYAPPGKQGDPGTVIIQEPPETNTTIVEVVSTITRPATRYVTPGTKGDPGTVFIDVPPNHNVTITTTVSTITRPSTTFAPGATEGDAGTVLVEMPPEYNVTTTQTVQTISRPVTRYSSPTEIGDPGTVYLDMPPEYNVTVTTTVYSITRQSTTFAAGATQGDPGTVIVQVPPEYNVTTTQTVQTISRPVTRYSKPAEIGDPGTIYVDLPPEYNVTVTTTVPTITRQSTTFASAAQRGDPGTIIIEMPPDTNTTITQTIQTITRPVTRYSKPGEVGDPGTIYVDLPPEYNVTRTTTVPTITRPSTTFFPAGTQGDAGTILVQLPPDTNVTTTQTVSTISRPITRYSTPGTAGDPGTVYVDLPPDYNVTRTTTVATITRASTTFARAGMQGDPGTVVVQLPPDYNVTTTETVSSISRVRTTYQPAGTQGDPNTVLIQVPIDYNVTTTETVSTITRVRTTYNPGATEGDPGTVLVEVPVEYNVTTTETVSTISNTRTTYNPGTIAGDPGTVLVQVPPTMDTTTQPDTAFISTSTDGNVGTSFEAPGGKFASPSGISGLSAPSTGPSSTGSQPSAPSSGISADALSGPSAPSASLPTGSQLSVPSAGLSAPSASLPTGSQLSVPSAGLSAPSASLPTGSQLSVPSAGRSAPSATLPTGSQLSVPSAGLSAPSASLPTGSQLSVPSAGLSAPSATLPTGSQLSVPSAGLSAPSATLPTGSQLSVPSDGLSGGPSAGIPSASTGVPATAFEPPGGKFASSSEVNSLSVPSASLPTGSQLSAPSAGLPSASQLSTPSASLPTGSQLSVPSASLPTGPQLSAPSAGLPSASQLSVPSASLLTGPQLSAPSASLPTGSQLSAQSAGLSSDSRVSTGDPGMTFEAPGGKFASSSGVSGLSAPSIGIPSVSGIISGSQASMPSAGIPSASLPSAGLPSASLPSAGLPSASVPSVSAPSASVPTANVPSASVPSVAVPSASLPTAGLPSASLPSAGLPSASVPSASAPSASVPTANVPSAGVPSVAVPSASLPSAGLPSAGVPTGQSAGLPSVGLSSSSVSTTSQTSVASVGIPSAGVPSVGLPSVSTSIASVPAVSVSSAIVSTAPTLVTSSSVQVPAVVSSSTSSKLPQASFGPTFDCDGFGYVISTLLGNTLTKVNLVDGTRTTVATGIGPGGSLLNVAGVAGAINGIGFNKLDGYIYGVVNQGVVSGVLCGLLGCASSQLIRIAKNGGYETLKLTIPSNMIDMGDVDEQGRFWVSENGKKWWCIDVNPASSTFGKLLNSGTSATDIISGVGDWAYVPGGGDYLYAIQASVIESGLLRTNIVRWSRTTYTWSRYQSYPNLVLTSLNLIWGAVMAGPDGTLYGQENLLGQTWKFTLGNTANPTSIPGGSIANLQGDGARCIDAKTVFPPFTCDGRAYVISNLVGNTLTSVNLNDGSRSTVSNNIGSGGAIDAIGYNKFDNYIYGVIDQGLVTGVVNTVLGGAQSQVIRIAQDGQYQTLSVTVPSNTITMGDVDDQGRLWLSESGKRWWCVDVNPTSPTVNKVIANGTSSADIISGIGDWAFVPGGGDYLYAVQASIIESGLMRTNIVRWSRTTRTWERYQSYPNLVLTSLNLVWGAVWAGPGGTLYAQENLLGQTWKFTLGSSANPVSIPGGSIANLKGDGARCIGLDPATTIQQQTSTSQQLPSITVTSTVTVPQLTQVVTSLALPGISGGPATLLVQVPAKSTVTTTQTVNTITRATTLSMTATNLGSPDTVLIQFPPKSTVTTTQTVNTITRATTTSMAAADPNSPDTVLIQYPPRSTVTTTQTVSTITRATTTSMAAADPNSPDTVLIQYPPKSTVTTTQTGVSSITRATTVSMIAADPNSPNTVLIQYPPRSTVTTTQTGVSSITRATTVSMAAADPNSPDTVLIQYPPKSTVTTTQTGVSSITRATTVSMTAADPNSPNTVLIQYPPKSTVTTTQTVSTITQVTTVSMTASDPGAPDTVLVQFPTPYNVTITTAGPTTLTATSTAYSPPGKAGDPGTVIVQRPPVTVTTVDSSAYTTYKPPGASGDAGTVVIATTTRPVAPAYTSAGPQFSCDVYGYLMQKTALYRVEITTGKTTLIKSTVGGGGWINGIGYNRFDDYIYGMYMDNSGTQLIRIGGDGTSTLLPARTSDRSVNMGDIDNQGRFWISNNGGAWWVIDLMPGSAKYGQIIMSGTATTSLKAADWAFVPGGGDFMYSVMYNSDGSSSTLCRFSRTSYTWQTMKSFGDITGDNIWGALYAAADGSLYGSENSSGNIYQFPIAPTIGNPKFISTGPVSSWNDGARCIDSQNLSK
ncbi:hypothetical protein FPOAC1_012228 [Fusarium poae]|uniref:hypothetical protein n=1 Tax=Fusarium poae TaxID=36050 RepID=UPI001CEADE40|nr:hypothetical protein FPOAC1_012228 [Fusarium poae]KAG8667397.1 hypothetical protein FPOAC1_012228 [Fusarium poae]